MPPVTWQSSTITDNAVNLGEVVKQISRFVRLPLLGRKV